MKGVFLFKIKSIFENKFQKVKLFCLFVNYEFYIYVIISKSINMLLQFTVKNYKVFGDEVKLNMIANADDTREDDNIILLPKFNLRILKSAVIYGANASGKSKLVEAMQFMRDFIWFSAETQSNRKINTVPFRLSTATEKAPSLFEIVFILDNDMYRYGFEVTTEKVVSEWLYHRPKTKEIEIFYRQEQDFEIHKSFKISDLIEKKRIKPNSLLLSKADVENDELATKITSFITINFNIISGLHDKQNFLYSFYWLQNLKDKKVLLDFFKSADLGIESLIINEEELNNRTFKEETDYLPSGEKFTTKISYDYILETVWTLRNKYDENGNILGTETFTLNDDESAGTQKYFALAGPILEALEKGTTLIIDELDAKLHPSLVHKIVEIFNSKTANPTNAQLIFNTHDTNLLSCGIFRRDQIWFVEKNKFGSADLYALSSFKTDTVRKNDNFEKNYVEGRYGAIPYLGDFDKLFNL